MFAYLNALISEISIKWKINFVLDSRERSFSQILYNYSLLIFYLFTFKIVKLKIITVELLVVIISNN